MDASLFCKYKMCVSSHFLMSLIVDFSRASFAFLVASELIALIMKFYLRGLEKNSCKNTLLSHSQHLNLNRKS